MPKRPTTPDEFVRQVADTFRATGPTKRTLTQQSGDAGTQGGQKFVNPMDDVGQMIAGGESGALEQVPAGTEGQVVTMTDVGAGVLKPRLADSGKHDPVTVTDSSSIDLTLSGQDITAAIVDEYVRDLVGGLLVAGTNVTVTVDDAGNTITIAATGGGSGAPTTATYITQTPDAGLSAEQALSALSTGLVKVTTGTGVLSTAVAGDLPAHTHAEADVTGLVTDLAGKQPLDATLTDLAALAPPGADRIVFYDQSATAHAYLTPGSGLSISGTTLAADVGGTLGQMNLPRWVTGRYYDVTSAVAASFSTGTYATGTLIAVLQYVPNTNTVDRIAVGVSAIAAVNARLGIYAMGSDGNPDALVLDAGNVSVNSTGTVAATISQSLTGGTWYWLAVTFSGTTGILYRAVPSGGPVGYATLVSTGNDAFAVDKAFTYGALPDPFGTPAIRTGHVPRIGVRAG